MYHPLLAVLWGMPHSDRVLSGISNFCRWAAAVAGSRSDGAPILPEGIDRAAGGGRLGQEAWGGDGGGTGTCGY